MLNNISVDTFYADNVGLVQSLANKYYGRMTALGATMTFDDVMQELSLVFVKSYELFDADKCKFSTYFTRAAQNRINHIAEKLEYERMGMKTTRNRRAVAIESSIEPAIGEDQAVEYKWVKTTHQVHAGSSSIEEMSYRSGNGDELSIEEVIASSSATPEQEAIGKNLQEYILSNLSPLASAIALMAIDPPEFVEREFTAQSSHAEYARSVGGKMRSKGCINVAFVCSIMEDTIGLDHDMVKSANDEISYVTRRATA